MGIDFNALLKEAEKREERAGGGFKDIVFTDPTSEEEIVIPAPDAKRALGLTEIDSPKAFFEGVFADHPMEYGKFLQHLRNLPPAYLGVLFDQVYKEWDLDSRAAGGKLKK